MAHVADGVVDGPSASVSIEQPANAPLEIIARNPTVAFDNANDDDVVEKPPRHFVPSGNRALEIRRELTQEDKELSRANYDHLEKQRSNLGEKGGDSTDNVAQVDIIEHKYSADVLAEKLSTSFDTKTPASSAGLTAADAATRLARDGPNVLTPPKKKSAFQKVRSLLFPISSAPPEPLS